MYKFHLSQKHSPTLAAFRSFLALLLSVLCVNLLVSRTEQHFGLRADISANQFTSLSDATLQILENLQVPVSVYTLYQDSTHTKMRMQLETMLGKYAAHNSRINLSSIDPVAEPGRILPHIPENTSVSEGSLLITNADESRTRFISAGELFNYIQNPSDGSYQASSFIGENKVTSAILQVSSTDMPRVFFLTGHNEIASSYCTTLLGQLRDSNYETADLLLGSDTELLPGDTVLLLAPALDITKDEYQLLKSWLDNGGRLLYAHNPMTDSTHLTNLNRLLSYYNLGFSDGLVVESSEETASYLSTPLCLVPRLNPDSEMLRGLNGRLLLLQCAAVKTPAMPLPGFQYETLLSSSEHSFLKSATDDENIFIRTETDPCGSFPLAMSAVRVNDANDFSKDTRILLLGTPYLLIDSSYLSSSYNLEFSGAGIDWLVNRNTRVPVFAKAIASTALLLPNADAFWRLSAIIVIAIPSLFLISGILVCYKRRHL